MKEIGFFSAPGRDPRGWVVSCAFCAYITTEERNAAKAGDDAARLSWWFATGTPQLAFDHNEIIRKALA